MNKRFLAIAIAASLAAPLTVMADGAEIYGVAHASLNKYSFDAANTADPWTLTSNNSRLGVKGSEDLGGGMKAVYKMEFGVDISDSSGSGGACTSTTTGTVNTSDGGVTNDPITASTTTSCANGNLTSRNQYVGISGGMGTALLGRHDTALKMVQGKFDLFNDTVADMVTSTGGGVDGDNRANNVITYFSPKMGGMQMIAQLIPGEGTTSGTACTSACDGIADGTSLSFTYEAGDMYVGLGIDSGDIVQDQMRLAATYKMDALQIGFLYNVRSDNAGSATDLANDEKGTGLSVKFGMGSGAVKGQFIQAADIGGTSGADATAFTLGYDMNLSARTTAYAFYNMYSPDTTGASQDVTVLSMGVAHNF